MDGSDCHAIEMLQDIPDDMGEPSGLGINNILDGSTPLNLSHAGGEFNQILEDDLRAEQPSVFLLQIYLLINSHHNYGRHRVDPRTRRDKVDRRTQGFNLQMGDIIEAYILWNENVEKNGLDGECDKPPIESVEGKYPIHVLDVFRKFCFLLF